MRACLESCSWCDDVHVLDSGSRDATCAIARELGATVHVNPFESFGQQRNWAIDHVEVKHRWQFHLDADERFTPASVEEMVRRLGAVDGGAAGNGSVDGVVGYRNPSMLMFMDSWLKHAGGYPVYQVRLIDRERCRYEDHGHGQREKPDGEIGTMDQPYLHYNFSKGLDDWFEKHTRYAKLEAAQAMDELGLELRLGDLFDADATARRRALKRLSYRVPLRAVLVMLYQFFLKGGWRDGKAGRNYIRMRSIYEAMIGVRMSVEKHKRSNPRTRGGAEL